jgi:L-alanine-DL-glutamate epimerase-like enolase superfamily enzyme
MRIDANQGWNFDEAVYALQAMGAFNIQFCEQPLRHWHDDRLPALKKMSPVKIMADESVFDHYDAKRLITSEACDYINIKFAKSGGILEATKINEICEQYHVPCMMGGMLESRVALTAFGHFAMAHENIVFYDMDTCLLGHTSDPVSGGIKYHGFKIEIPETIGIGADVDQSFLDKCEKVLI